MLTKLYFSITIFILQTEIIVISLFDSKAFLLVGDGLGLKNLLPAYRDPFLSNDDLSTGVSFASGGSGLDAFTANLQVIK